MDLLQRRPVRLQGGEPTGGRRSRPRLKDQSWFFDTELLVLAEKQGYRIKDVPVLWIEDDDSRVKIVRTAWDDIKGVIRLRWTLWRLRFSTQHRRAIALRKGTVT